MNMYQVTQEHIEEQNRWLAEEDRIEASRILYHAMKFCEARSLNAAHGHPRTDSFPGKARAARDYGHAYAVLIRARERVTSEPFKHAE